MKKEEGFTYAESKLKDLLPILHPLFYTDLMAKSNWHLSSCDISFNISPIRLSIGLSFTFISSKLFIWALSYELLSL